MRETREGAMVAVSAWPMAQRADEVDAATRAIADRDRLAVVFHGPAGVGKTRLADTCLAVAQAEGRTTIRVAASQAAAVMPLAALAPLLPRTAQVDATPADLFDQTRDELLAQGGADRLVLFVDDAHLLDATSAVLLTQLLDARAVFLLATVRLGEALPDAVASWLGRDTTLCLDITDLDSEGSGQVLELALGGVVAAATIGRFHQASGGNPLLLRELVHQAIEQGRLTDSSGTWRLEGEIPPALRLRDLMATRLAALPAAARSVLDDLALCAPLGPAELVVPMAAEVLAELERDGIVQRVIDGHRHQLVLGHPLYGEVVRGALGVARRRAILLATADRVESLGSRRREDDLRAATWRLDAGGSQDPEVLLRAARSARHAHDFAQVERLATVLWGIRPTGEVAVLLGEAHWELGSFAASMAVLEAPVPSDTPQHLLVERATLQVQNLLWGCADWSAALEVTHEAQRTIDVDHLDDLIAAEAGVSNFTGHPRRALELIATVPDRSPRSRVLRALVSSQALTTMGRTTAAIEVAAAGFAEHLALDEPLGLPHYGLHVVNQAVAMMEDGRFPEAEAIIGSVHQLTVTEGNPFGQIWFAVMLGTSCDLQGRTEEARRWFQDAASGARAHGQPVLERIGQAALAGVEAQLGNAAAASAAIGRARDLPPLELHCFHQVIGWGWAAWAGGDPEGARALLTEHAAAAAALDNIGFAARAWHDAARLGAVGIAPHLAGLAAKSDSPVVAARAEHVRAMATRDAVALGEVSDTFESMGMVLLAAEAACGAAAAHAQGGAKRLATSWTRRAQLLTTRCPGVRTPGLLAASELALSRREREVAHLARSGLQSQAIADRLSLSVRTVDNHLSRVYEKLGIAGRDELSDALDRR